MEHQIKTILGRIRDDIKQNIVALLTLYIVIVRCGNHHRKELDSE
jgi:hypothetical protein